MPARSLQDKEGVSFIQSWLGFLEKQDRKSPPNIYTSLKFLTAVRCLYAVLVLIYSTMWLSSSEVLNIDISTYLLLGCVIEIFSFTAVCCILLLKKRFIRPITYVSMLHDSLLAAFIVLITGAHSSPFYYLFLIIPLYGGIILQRRGGVLGAFIGTSVLAAVFLGLPKFSFLFPHGMRELYELLVLTYGYSVSRILFLMVACFGVGILTGQLSHQYMRVQSDLIETELEFSHLRGIYEILLNALPIGIVILNPKTNRLLYANPSAKYLLPLDSENMTIDAVLKPETSKIELEVGDAWHRTFNGRHLRIARFKLSLVDDTQLNGYHISDITELHEAQQELVRRQRMELLGEFSAKVAHEIRNPLACISGCNEMLQSEIQNDDQKELLSMMGDEINRLNNLLNDILLFSRRPKLKPTCIELSALLEKRKSVFLNDPQNTNIAIELDIPPECIITADETTLAQIVMTLWRNSAEAMEGKGLIRVMASLEHNAIQFFDEGPGLTDELAAHVFEPFYTTKSSGTGLGLSIARQLSLDNHLSLSWDGTQKCFVLALNQQQNLVNSNTIDTNA